MVRLSLILITMLLTVASELAHADVGTTYGFGSRSAALAGAVVAGPNDGFSAYSNPARMTETGENRWTFSYGLLIMEPSFTDISGIVLQDTYTADAPLVGDVNNDYKATLGQLLSLTYRLTSAASHLTLGVVSFLPINQFAYVDSGETFIPEYVLYRSRTQRPQVEFGLGADLTDEWHFGVGFHTAFSLASNADAYIKSGYGVSTMRFSSTLKPKVGPYIGTHFTPKDSPFTGGLVVRFPVASNSTINLTTSAQVVGFLPSIPLALTALSTIYYDPFIAQLGGSYRASSGTTLYAELDFERWSKFEAPALVITNPQWFGGSGSVTLQPGPELALALRDVLVPRAGIEYDVGDTILRAGYGYHPSIFKDAPSGAGNYLDPSKHMFNVGVGWKFKHFFGGPHDWNLDLNGSYQLLVTQHVVKTPGDETGATTDPAGSGNPTSKVGSPGYDAGGKVYGGGASLTVAF